MSKFEISHLDLICNLAFEIQNFTFFHLVFSMGYMVGLKGRLPLRMLNQMNC